jgi:hypothetical protein
MSEHDDTLRKTLEEVARLRSEREESLRDLATNEYSGQLRYAERIYWLYALVCIAAGVAAINFFVRSYDMKTLIGCAVIMLVVYETTVLMKLWFHMARMKMHVLKETKLLRLELAKLESALGVEQPSQPPVKYEPMHGLAPWERKLWLAACVALGMGISSLTSYAWFDSGSIAGKTVVTLAADGSAEKRQEITHGYSEVYRIPAAATFSDGIWTYNDGLRHKGANREYCLTIVLPPRAELVSTEPTAAVDAADGRTQVRFQGVAMDDVQYTFAVRYKLASTQEE